jgi:heat-inducible transcriptional repressor
MAFESLSDREKRVLACLISHYVKSADPVGSRVIANKFRLGISPATIRNTMQDLEEMGLVQQPHTSAGRIPTDAGYRLFVDRLLRTEPLNEAEKQAIEESLMSGGGGVDSILEQTSRVLADLSHQLGITISPKLDDSVLSQIELIQMAEGKVLVVLAFQSGLARTILVEVDAPLSQADLEEMSRVFNEKLTGLSLGQLRTTIKERLADSGGHPRLLRLFVEEDSEIWNSLSVEKTHIGGTLNIINQPEFSNREKLQDIITLVEKRTGLIKLFKDSGESEGGIIITIGAENQAKEIQSCSVVSASYKAGKTSGTIGIIGPTRMPYAKLASLVKYAAKQLGRVFGA